MSQPQIKTDIEARVQDTGDVMTGALFFVDNNKYAELFVDGQQNYCTYLSYRDSSQIGQIMIQKNNLLFSKYDGTKWYSYEVLHDDNIKNKVYTLTPIYITPTTNVLNLGPGRYTIDGMSTAEEQEASGLPQISWHWEFFIQSTRNGTGLTDHYKTITAYTYDNKIWQNALSWQTWQGWKQVVMAPASGVSGTYGVNISGNAATATTATKATQDGNGKVISSTYLPLSGGTMKGEIKLSFKNCVATGSYQASATTVPNLVEEVRYSSGAMGSVSLTESYGSIPIGWYNFLYVPHRSGGFNGTANGDNHDYGTLTLYGMTVASQHWRIRFHAGSIVETKRIWNQGDSVTSAVWNDYAECRESEIFEPGYVLAEAGDDTLVLTTERLQAFAGVSSDTWGFSQGETEKAKTPIAVAGRVLVYPAEDRENYQPGDCVCAAPNGKVSKMTRKEIIEWPDRIVGKVSCVPDYEEWGGGENADREPVKVNGRIWIQVK